MKLSKGARTAIGIGLGVLVLGGLSVAGYFMFRKPKKSSGKTDENKGATDVRTQGAGSTTTPTTTPEQSAQTATSGRGGDGTGTKSQAQLEAEMENAKKATGGRG